MSNEQTLLIAILVLFVIIGPVAYKVTQRSTWGKAFGFFKPAYAFVAVLAVIFLIGCRSHTLDYPDASERVPATAPLGHTIVCVQGDPLCKAEDSADD